MWLFCAFLLFPAQGGAHVFILCPPRIQFETLISVVCSRLLLLVALLGHGRGNLHLLEAVADTSLARVRSEVLAKGPLLEVQVLPVGAVPAAGDVAVIDTLGELPELDTTKEETGGDEDDTPLPSDALVLEDGVADDRDVLEREEGDEAEHDGPEEELVAPDIMHPLGEVLLGAGLHAEEGSSLVNHLPGEEQREPGQAGKGGGTRLEDGLAAVAVLVVAVNAELTVTKGVQAEHESAEAQGGDPDTIDNHVNDELDGKDTSLERLGRSAEDASDGTLETETHVGETRGSHDDPHDLDGGDGEDGETCAILEDESDEQDESLRDVGGEHVEDELLDVVKDTATLLDGGHDRGKVVVAENDIRGILGDIRTGLTHGNTDIGTAERGRIVDTITSLLQSVNRVIIGYTRNWYIP